MLNSYKELSLLIVEVISLILLILENNNGNDQTTGKLYNRNYKIDFHRIDCLYEWSPIKNGIHHRLEWHIIRPRGSEHYKEKSYRLNPIDWRPESAEPTFIQESLVELLAFPYLFWNGKGTLIVSNTITYV